MKAKEIYHEEKGHAFKWDLAWEVLRDAPKWLNEGAPIINLSNPADSAQTDAAAEVPNEPERPIGIKAAKSKRHAEASSKTDASERLAAVVRGQELLERRIKAQEEGNKINAGFLKLEVESKRSQTIMNDIKVLNMKEEDCKDISAIIALREIKREISVKYEQD